MNLQAYFDRIGYAGPIEPTLDVLRAIHRGHATHIAYENLDVLLQVPVSMAVEDIFEKIVTRKRGGWCYEMNTLLGWALSEVGFKVTRLVGGVMRDAFGDDAFGNHLVLRVDLNEPWIADCGIGDCFTEPVVLSVGEHSQGHRTFRLEEQDDGTWRLHNQPGAMPATFDFINAPADEALLASTCARLQADDDSMFRNYLICQRMSDDGGDMVIGTNRIDMRTKEEAPIKSAGALVAALTEVIGAVPERTESVWPIAVRQSAQG